jgi:hypothetical protein
MPRGPCVSAPSPSPVSGSSRRYVDRCPPPSVARCCSACQTHLPPLSSTYRALSQAPPLHRCGTPLRRAGRRRWNFSPCSFSSCPQAHNTAPRPLPPIHTDVRTHRRGHHHRHYRLRSELHPPRRSVHFFTVPHSPSSSSYCRTLPPPSLATLTHRSHRCCWKRRRDDAPSHHLSSVARYSEPHPLTPCPTDSPFDPGARAASPATPTRSDHRRRPCRGRRTVRGDHGSCASTRTTDMGRDAH